MCGLLFVLSSCQVVVILRVQGLFFPQARIRYYHTHTVVIAVVTAVVTLTVLVPFA